MSKQTGRAFVFSDDVDTDLIYHNKYLAETDPAGYFTAGERCRTAVPGLYVAGDCRTKEIRQLTTAVGDGAVAALAACAELDAR